jgi:hypothetical protein
MSMAEMQACLGRLYADRAFRRLFALEPDTVLGEYRLSPEEAQALRDLDGPALERFARSLRAKRRRRFVSTYPLLFGLDCPAVDRYYDRYYQLYPARPGGAYVDELTEFGRFMEECLVTDDEAPPFAADLARYERLQFAAGRAGRPRSGRVEEWKSGSSGPDPSTLPFFHSSILPDDRPRLADGVIVGTFRTGILAIVEALKADLPPPGTGNGPYTFVFRPGESGTDPAAFYVSEATARLLDSCDGGRTLAELAAVESDRRGDGAAAAVAEAIRALLEQGILTTAPPGRSALLAPAPDPGPWLPDGH